MNQTDDIERFELSLDRLATPGPVSHLDRHVLMVEIRDALRELRLWRWMLEMRLHLERNSIIGGPAWVIVDVDDEAIGGGADPVSAMIAAHNSVEQHAAGFRG